MDRLSSQQYEARDIMQLLGINRNRLFYWTHTHRLLVPGIAEPEGTGKRAKFSVKNLIELAFIKALVDFGTDLKTVREVKAILDKKYKELGGINSFEYAIGTTESEDFNIWFFRDRTSRLRVKVGYYFESGDPDEMGGVAEFDCDGGPKNSFRGSPVSIQARIGEIAQEVLRKLGKE